MVVPDLLGFTVNDDFFASFPWGRSSYLKLLPSMCKDFKDKAEDRMKRINQGAPENIPMKYTVMGFWQAFVVSFSLSCT